MKELVEWRDWYNDTIGHNINWVDSLDPWIKKLVQFLNELPGCVTLCSCAGAGPVGGRRGLKHESNDTGYVMLKTTDVQVTTLIVLAACDKDLDVLVREGSGEGGPNTGTISLYGEYKQIKKFERRIRTLVKQYINKKEVSVDFRKKM